ncbi:MAG: FAD-dependent oxidoreductase [Candidatus Micrarchaeota archaeon]|nr:FAD-dependent oxidoreductase [Candidatus Micrarchaeota archaeon]MDE1804168.1 FAD-dependent oxidoreductase [Candidatus Micrarchaeota archaeon]MDE1846724.1 FAD-dependent oxidoreductase [Candidatus Micrarchaeota archaeon]
MEKSYDVIVAGAGIAGSLAAAAAAKGGAKTLLLDRNTPVEPGKKTNWGWVCGDAVAKSHIDYIHKEIGISFGEPELELKVDGVFAISPDFKNKIQFDGEGYVLDRPKFGNKIRDIAIKMGAEYVNAHEVEGPLLEGNQVVGVFGRDHNKEQFKVNAKLVIDTLGIASTLRRKLPPNEFIQKDISIDDIESTGRYIVDFEPTGTDPDYYDAKNCLIHLNQELAPGGYGWVFPKRGNKVNIGLGVEKHSLDIRNAKLSKKDTLHSLIDQYIEWNPIVKNTKMNNEHNNAKGYWSVTVRRQLDCLVYNGYLGAGDSMAMPNPISAGGIGPAMVAGVQAGQVAAEAVANKRTDMEYLWKYNLMYNQSYGNKTAGLEVFRIYLQSLNNELINYGMAHFLTKEEAIQISYGQIPEITMGSAMTKVLHGVSNINAFRNLLFVVKEMKKLTEMYNNYPKDVAHFSAWSAAVNAEMAMVKEKFKPNPI